jgi:hypothetical protein
MEVDGLTQQDVELLSQQEDGVEPHEDVGTLDKDS